MHLTSTTHSASAAAETNRNGPATTAAGSVADSDLALRIRRRVQDPGRAAEILRDLDDEGVTNCADVSHLTTENLCQAVQVTVQEANAIILDDTEWQKQCTTWLDLLLLQLTDVPKTGLEKARRAISESGVTSRAQLMAKLSSSSVPGIPLAVLNRLQGMRGSESTDADCKHGSDCCSNEDLQQLGREAGQSLENERDLDLAAAGQEFEGQEFQEHYDTDCEPLPSLSPPAGAACSDCSGLLQAEAAGNPNSCQQLVRV